MFLSIKRCLKLYIKEIFYSITDAMDLLFHRRDSLTPPKRKIFVGDGDFKEIGQEFFRYFIDIGKLKPSESVADIGCGIGRMAVPLTKYLDRNGSYDGLDIVPGGVEWCNKNIARRYPNFRFTLADVFNKNYNPSGKQKAFEYRFPYKAGSFDFVFLTSVFTHMLPRDLENYFSEVARVLKNNGRCLITYFLLNADSAEFADQKLSSLNFQYDAGEFCRSINRANPEAAVAYDENFILSLYKKFGMKITQPIRYGSWCGRKNFLSYQDIILATKE